MQQDLHRLSFMLPAYLAQKGLPTRFPFWCRPLFICHLGMMWLNLPRSAFRIGQGGITLSCFILRPWAPPSDSRWLWFLIHSFHLMPQRRSKVRESKSITGGKQSCRLDAPAGQNKLLAHLAQ